MIISKELLVNNIKKDIADNSSGQVSPEDIRRNLLDLIDSVSLLTRFSDLNSLNYSTEDPRTVRAGVDTLSKRSARGYSSFDNVAIGFSSLKSLIEAERNTAVGSFSLQCNMYGGDNVGLGYNALGSTINGHGNVGLGNFSLNSNKEGNFNIAIGHAAGYYVDRDKNYQFYLASHPVNSDYICENTSGFGLIPLLRGDLSSSSLRLGIAVRDLHDNATLQIGGHTHPSVTNSFNLGSFDYRFKNIYLQSSILFPNNNYIDYRPVSNNYKISSDLYVNGFLETNGTIDASGSLKVHDGHIEASSYISGTSGIFTGDVDVSGDILPFNNVSSDLGYSDKQWRNAYLYNIYSNGVSRFNVFQAEHQTHFRNKTIYLASTYDMDTLDGGGAEGVFSNFDPNNVSLPAIEHAQYLLDEELIGAGFKIGASGVNYKRTYELTFKSRHNLWSNLSIDDAFSRSSWFSNISLETAKGSHVKTDRIINDSSIGMFTYDNDLGLFIESGVVFFSEESDHLNRSGLGNINFIAPVEEQDSFSISLQSPSSGVNLFQSFLERTSENTENITGFKTGYISDSYLAPPNFFNEEKDQRPNRYIISSYHESNFAIRCFTLLQDESEGYVGISNFDYSESMLPDTIINVRSTGNAICRLTAENSNNTHASVQLLGKENCLDYGASLEYVNNSGLFHVRSFDSSIQNYPISIDCRNGHVGILNQLMSSHGALSIGDENNTEVSIALAHSSGAPIPTSGYAHIFTRSAEGLDLQNSVLSFMDSSGNLFNVNLTASSADGTTIDKPLALDNKGNTFGGVRSPVTRANITASTVNNTAIGYEALSNIQNGTNNTAIGYRAGKNVTAGDNNIFIGSNANATSDGDINNVILIGTNLDSGGGIGDNTILIGHGSSPLIEGFSSNLNINGKLKAQNIESDSNLRLGENATVNVDYFDGSFRTFRPFLHFKQEAGGDVNDVNSFALEVNGRIDLAGKLKFNNDTFLENANFLNDIQSNAENIALANQNITNSSTSLNQLKQRVDEIVIEGIVTSNIRVDELPNSFNDSPRRFTIRKYYVNSTTDRLEPVPSTNNQQNLAEAIVVLRDPYLNVRQGDYVIAMKVNGEYRPVSVTGAP